jgi:hypothetical protein
MKIISNEEEVGKFLGEVVDRDLFVGSLGECFDSAATVSVICTVVTDVYVANTDTSNINLTQNVK